MMTSRRRHHSSGTTDHQVGVPKKRQREPGGDDGTAVASTSSCQPAHRGCYTSRGDSHNTTGQSRTAAANLPQPLAYCRMTPDMCRDPLHLRRVRPNRNGELGEFPPPSSANTSDPLNLRSVVGVRRRGKRRRLPDDATVEAESHDTALESKKKALTSEETAIRGDSAAVHGVANAVGSDSQAQPLPESTGNVEPPPAPTEEGVKGSGHKQAMIERYRFGNFNNYYRHLCSATASASSAGLTSMLRCDPRVALFCREWFCEKSVLDVGCNSGVFTLSLAKVHQPKCILGVDIDGHLIGAARKNLRLCADHASKLTSRFPASFGANYGPISLPSTSVAASGVFPGNARFRQENYVKDNEEELTNIRQGQYDAIIAVGTLAYVHLNWGDAGLKRFFKRCFLELRAGGRFVAEVEEFDWYRRRYRKLPDHAKRIFESIKLFPRDFTAYLLSPEIGFSHQEEIDTRSRIAREMDWSGRVLIFHKHGEFVNPGAAVQLPPSSHDNDEALSLP